MTVIYKITILAILFSTSCIHKGTHTKENNISSTNLITGKIVENTNIEFVNKVFDAGEVKAGTIVNAIYKYKNTGKSPLIISNVLPDCHCTGYELNKDSLLPEETGMLKLFFNTENKIGAQKIYTIMTVNTDTKLYKLTLKAFVIR